MNAGQLKCITPPGANLPYQMPDEISFFGMDTMFLALKWKLENGYAELEFNETYAYRFAPSQAAAETNIEVYEVKDSAWLPAYWAAANSQPWGGPETTLYHFLVRLPEGSFEALSHNIRFKRPT